MSSQRLYECPWCLGRFLAQPRDMRRGGMLGICPRCERAMKARGCPPEQWEAAVWVKPKAVNE